MLKKLKNEEGFTLLIFLSLLLMLTMIGIAAVMTSTTDVNIAGNDLKSINTFYSAEAGLEKAIAQIRAHYTSGATGPPNPLPTDSFELGNIAVIYSTADNGAATLETLTVGAYKGLYALVKSFTITSRAKDNGTQTETKIESEVKDALVPIFQFAVFYEQDLEILPGPNMTLGGRVHSNHDLYLGSRASLKCDSWTTAAGDIYHGRKDDPSDDMTGDVTIKDRYGVYQSMKNADGTWLDANDPAWVSSSLNRWGGQVQDNSHGITELNLPVVVSGDPIDMIKRASGGNTDSYENTAGLKIVDGQVLYKNASDVWVNVTSTFTSTSILTTKSFYNYREGKTVTAYDIDISKLNTSGYYPRNGILYASRNQVAGTQQAIRLINGATLSAPLSVVSNNPLYTLGNYNSVNKKAAALFTDALTVLSTNWSDANSDKSLSNRVANNTTVNAAFLTGNSQTSLSHYNGGLENLPRFLETWSGKTFTYRGSMVDLWFSEQATGAWVYGSPQYEAPNRDWAFDLAFLDPNNLPPGVPHINTVLKVSWVQRIVSQ
ncbi:MAG TPA: PilX N-terminal domain-containing pilus assembly protein [candidate division Zixibacteria bacterium]